MRRTSDDLCGLRYYIPIRRHLRGGEDIAAIRPGPRLAESAASGAKRASLKKHTTKDATANTERRFGGTSDEI
jgi:hypothetical protein